MKAIELLILIVCFGILSFGNLPYLAWLIFHIQLFLFVIAMFYLSAMKKEIEIQRANLEIYHNRAYEGKACPFLLRCCEECKDIRDFFLTEDPEFDSIHICMSEAFEDCPLYLHLSCKKRLFPEEKK